MISAGAYFAVLLVASWLFGYGVGQVFVNTRKFFDKVK